MKRSASIFKDFLSAAPEAQKSRNRFIVWTSFLIAAILLYLTLRGLDWGVFFETLQGANFGYIGLLLIWSSISYFVRAMRWRVLLNSIKVTSPLSVFWANMAGYLGNNILPARAGELVRAVYAARKENISVAFVLATGITERLVDLAALVIIGAASVFWLDAFPKSVQEALQSFSLVAVGGVLFILLLPLFHGRLIHLVTVSSLWKSQLRGKTVALLDHFLKGIKVITQSRRGFPFIILTVAIWFMDGVGMVIMALALHETLSLLQSFLLIAALGLSSAIPSTPGYVGVYQFVAVTVLSPLGFSREMSLALILLVQFLNLVVVLLWGGLGMWLGARGLFGKNVEVVEDGDV